MKNAVLPLTVLATACLVMAGCSAAGTSMPAARSVADPPSVASSSSMPIGGESTGSDPDSTTPITVTGSALVGQKIFLSGMGPRGHVKFTGGSDDVGNGACANCHGKDGGGGDGPMISWSMLTMKGSTMGNMPKYAYTSPEQVVAAVTTGTRPDGMKLKPAMPRYQLTAAEAQGVIDYLKALR